MGLESFTMNPVCVCFVVVTEDEVALALTDGEEVPSHQLSTNGLRDAEAVNAPSNCNTEETQ